MSGVVADRAPPLVFLVAGEPSGDLLGGRLMAALKDETSGDIRFAGVGGDRMAAEGLESLFPIRQLAVMGIVEVLPHLLTILRRIRETVAAAIEARPAAVVTIDSPSFTLEVSQRLRGRGIPLIHYVAPSVWAWKPWRAKHIAGFLDRLLVLLPFEPPYFEKHDLATSFVGHPAVEQAPRTAEAAAFRARHGIPPEAVLLCVLPGSRSGEVRRLLPVFAETVARLKTRFVNLMAVVPTVPNVADTVADAVTAWAVPTVALHEPGEKYEAFAAANAALAASGTVAVELAVAGTPSVIGYRVSPLSAFLARRLIKIRYMSLVNLVLDHEAQPEFLQRDCTPAKLAEAVERLLTSPSARDAQLAACRDAVRALGLDGEAPSRRAARAVLSTIGGAGGRSAPTDFDRNANR